MILLDTQALLWLMYAPERIGPRARDQIGAGFPVYASAISHVEVGIKKMLGKLEVPDDFAEEVRRAGLSPLPMTVRHASAIVDFPGLRGNDPFDRQIVAQAHADGLDLYTSDHTLLDLGEEWIVDVRR